MQPIYLLRHGQTASNASRVLQFPDTPLSDRGQAQAQALGERLAREVTPGIAEVWTSDYSRAQATGEAVARATGAPIDHDPLLRERDFGELRGKPYDDIGFDAFAPDLDPPGGESWDVFYARVDRAWEQVCARAAQASGPIAVVTHGLVCYAVVDRCLRGAVRADDAMERQAGGFENTSVTLIEGPAPFRLALVGCAAHLGPELR